VIGHGLLMAAMGVLPATFGALASGKLTESMLFACVW